MNQKDNSRKDKPIAKNSKKGIKNQQEPDDIGSDEKELDISNESKREIVQLISQLAFSREHRGPLPAPEDFKEYENILPGAADRILKMAEEVTYAKTGELSKRTDIESRNSLIGLMAAIILALLFLGMSFFMVLKGYPIAGIIGFISELGALVYTFVYGSKARYNEKRSKSKKDSK